MRLAPVCGLAAALLLPLLLPLLPAAHAQLPVPLPGAGTTDARITMDLDDPGGPLVPARPYTFLVRVHYIYGSGAVVPPGQDSCATLAVNTTLPWVAANLTPETVCFAINPTATGGTTVDNQTLLGLNLTTEAPALGAFNITVTAHADENGPIRAADGQVSHIFLPGFVGKVQLRPIGAVAIQGGLPQRVPLVLKNLGNGPIMVRFQNATAPQNVRVELPMPLVLEHPGDEGTAFLTLRAPWTAPVKGQVDVIMATAHPTRNDLAGGDAPRARFDLQGKAAVPGPEAALVLLAVAGLARVAGLRA
jgi:hypothetical protein